MKSPYEFVTMRPHALSLSIAVMLLVCVPFFASERALGELSIAVIAEAKAIGFGGAQRPQGTLGEEEKVLKTNPGSSRSLVLVASLTVFVLSVFVGFEIIAKVPPTLHTPLMSGSNAISGITVVGAIIAAGYKETGIGSLLGLVAISLAMINVVGGFLVTHRMLLMFKKR